MPRRPAARATQAARSAEDRSPPSPRQHTDTAASQARIGVAVVRRRNAAAGSSCTATRRQRADVLPRPLAAVRGSPPALSCAPAIERDALTRPPARPGANAGARSSTRPPCAPMPGSRNGACGMSSRMRAMCSGTVAPTTAPTSDSPLAALRRCAELGDDLRQALPDRAALAGELEVLDIGGTGVRRPHEHEDACAGRARAVDERLQRVDAEQRVGREGVGAESGDLAERCRRAADERLRVGGCGDRDVAALAVGEDEQAALLGVGDGGCERRSSRRRQGARSRRAAA